MMSQCIGCEWFGYDEYVKESETWHHGEWVLSYHCPNCGNHVNSEVKL